MKKIQKSLLSRNPVFFLFSSELVSKAASSNAVVICSFLQVTENNHDLGNNNNKKNLYYNIFISIQNSV